ncbi:hypothetical protein [Sagittula sp. SSi028]|uniref:hypothetical protein n=1 Tax=Sagittula sp. SSi028 TaxID=3400636 RepID=UPI003AF77013
MRPAPIIALGAQRYRVDHIRHDLLSGICDVAMLADRIVVLRRGAPELVVMDLAGEVMTTADLPDFVWPHGLRASAEGLAVTDVDGHKVVFLSPDLIETGRLHCDNRPALGRPFNHPTDCVQGPDGRWYVSDGYGNAMVHIFDAGGAHLRSFGQPGEAPGAFSTPHNVAFDAAGRLCVADRENNRVQRFDPEGRYLDSITGVYKPMALAMTGDGLLLVTDQTPRLSAYDAQGTLVGRCRTFSIFGHGLAVTAQGVIVIAEMSPDRVSLLTPIAD